MIKFEKRLWNLITFLMFYIHKNLLFFLCIFYYSPKMFNTLEIKTKIGLANKLTEYFGIKVKITVKCYWMFANFTKAYKKNLEVSLPIK